ncbi:translation initiation factor IF-2-like [Antechinus flavipes]|uniref:translation initiation factor IF-2-like n=1 Tax=Antechinus flavipes TaxID=38775 RepID=UPI0022363068|nr:translation initiation factor IF-2-like [Antechinus flavipes]
MPWDKRLKTKQKSEAQSGEVTGPPSRSLHGTEDRLEPESFAPSVQRAPSGRSFQDAPPQPPALGCLKWPEGSPVPAVPAGGAPEPGARGREAGDNASGPGEWGEEVSGRRRAGCLFLRPLPAPRPPSQLQDTQSAARPQPPCIISRGEGAPFTGLRSPHPPAPGTPCPTKAAFFGAEDEIYRPAKTPFPDLAINDGIAWQLGNSPQTQDHGLARDRIISF